MLSKTSTKQKTPAVAPHQTMKGHTKTVTSVVHLPQGQRTITCSSDGSLRLWDLQSGVQIGGDWRDEEEKEAIAYEMALSPNGKTIVSGSQDGKVKLWDVTETGKIVAKWTGHTNHVMSVCWSADGNRVGSVSHDGIVRVWDVKSGERILEIETGHNYVCTVIYSPDNTKIATGGQIELENAVKIWDAKMGELIATLNHSELGLDV